MMHQLNNATTIRQPSVANLMIDSLDRKAPATTNAGAFGIVKNQSMFNGFFTRVGATEVVLEWNVPNIINTYNGSISFTITGAHAGTYTANLLEGGDGFITVGGALDNIVQALNDSVAVPGLFEVVQGLGVYGIGITEVGADITAISSIPNADGRPNLAEQLKFLPQSLGTSFVFPVNPDLRPARYLDFVSSDLTYCQDVKDATSAPSDRNVLLRWYFAYDSPVPTDIYNYPILMGYEPFYLRRIFNPAKQIRWNNNLPIGNLSFEVFNNRGANPFLDYDGEWLMTLQISED
jgi:hypothetical protein